MRASAISEPQPRPARLGRPVARRQVAHDYRLALFELAPRDLGVGAVADAELHGDRGWFAVRPDDPHAAGGATARASAAALPPTWTRRPLALGGLDTDRPEAKR